MPISKDLLLAILSMDSYNRGYDAGISDGLNLVDGVDRDGLGDDSDGSIKIGNATVSNNLTDFDLDADSQDAGFYAISYTISDGSKVDGLETGDTIISYRGTDQNISIPFWSDSGSDLWNGYGTSVGSSLNDQAHLAAEFFQAVTETSDSDPRTGSAVLTGHSLGGGLAGFIGGIYNQEAVLFDNMPFELATFDAFQRAATWLPSPGDLVAKLLWEDFYNELEPWAPTIPGNIKGYTVPGEFINAARLLQSTPVASVGPSGTIDNLLAIPNPFKLHSQALLVTLMFGDKAEYSEWSPVIVEFLRAFFDDEVSQASVISTAFDKDDVKTALAYSALEKNADGSGLVFGNTGIRAMFDDLNELGQVYAQANDATRNTFLDSDLDDGFIFDTAIEQLLVDIAVQYAGALAINKVEQIRANLLTGVDANEGVFGLDANKSVLAIDFSDVLWRDVLQTSTSTSTGIAPLHKDSLIDAFHAQTTFWDWLTGTSIADKLDQLAQDYWGGTDRGIFDRYHIATGINGTTIALSERSYHRDSGTHVDVYIGDENKINDVTGTSGDDLILTGNTTDFITGGKGKNFINAGDGVDEARYLGDGGYPANDNRLIIGRLVA